ncbi:MAG: histidine kinase [Methylotenera sp.]|nr:histidine kinase [Methylotenera sp.]
MTTSNNSLPSQSDMACLTQAAFRLNLIYWVCMFLADCVLGYFVKIDPIESTPLKLTLFGVSALMTYVMARILIRVRGLSFPLKALLCLVMTIIAVPVYTAIDFLNLYPQSVTSDPIHSGYTLIQYVSMVFGWNCLFLAVTDNFETGQRELQLAAIREVALTSKMQALRYQVNPHFLFNTLNSIAGLIEEGATTRAERMVLSLSTFMRTTLEVDPMSDVKLSEEIALQEEYLGIERERFLDRLTFKIEMPEALQDALVPSLILQPLIENAIKHGVGAATGQVEISLTASSKSDRLVLTVENDIPLDNSDRKNPFRMGVGLRNVQERLHMRFQGNSQFSSGIIRPGRYQASIDLPFKIA